MTVINHHFAGFTTSARAAIGVRSARTIGDYLPAVVGGVCGFLAGAVTLVAMLSPGTY